MMAMKIVDHLFDGLEPSRQVLKKIVLAPAVNPNVRVRVPDEYAVNSAITLIHVIEISIDRILARCRIIKLSVVDHHLRLNKAGLCPKQSRIPIESIVVSSPD